MQPELAPEEEALAPDAAEQQGPGKPAPAPAQPAGGLLESTFDYIKKEKLKGVAENLPNDYYEFEEGMLSDPDNVKALHSVFKEQKWEGADLSDEEFSKLLLGGIKKKALSGAGGEAAGVPASAGFVPPGLAPPTPTSTGLPDPTTFGDQGTSNPTNEEFIADGQQVPGGPAAVGVGDVPTAAGPPVLTDAPPKAYPAVDPPVTQDRPLAPEESAFLEKLPGDARPVLAVDDFGHALLRNYDDLPQLADGFTRVRVPDDYQGAVPEKTYTIPGSTEPGARYFDRPLSKEVAGEGEQGLGLAAARNFNNLIADGFKGLATGLDDASRVISDATGLRRGGAFADVADVLEKTKKPVADYYKNHDLIAHPNAKNLLMATSDVAGMAVPLVAQALAAPEVRGGQLAAKVLGAGAGLMFDGQIIQGAHDRAVAAGMNPDQAAVYTLLDGGLSALTFKAGGELLGQVAGKVTPEAVKSEIMRETYRLLAARPAGQQLARKELEGVLAQATAAATPRLLKIAAEGGKLGTLFGVNEAKTMLTEAAARGTIGAKFTQPTLGEAVRRVVGATVEGATIGSLTGAASPSPKRVVPLGRTPQGRPLSVELSEAGEPVRYLDDQGEVQFGPDGPPPAVQQAVAAAQSVEPAPLESAQVLSHQKVPVGAHPQHGALFADYDMQGAPTRVYNEQGRAFSYDDPAVRARVESKWPDAPKEPNKRDASASPKGSVNPQEPTPKPSGSVEKAPVNPQEPTSAPLYAPVQENPRVAQGKTSREALPTLAVEIQPDPQDPTKATFTLNPQADQPRLIGDGLSRLGHFFDYNQPVGRIQGLAARAVGRMELRDGEWHVVEKGQLQVQDDAPIPESGTTPASGLAGDDVPTTTTTSTDGEPTAEVLHVLAPTALDESNNGGSERPGGPPVEPAGDRQSATPTGTSAVLGGNTPPVPIPKPYATPAENRAAGAFEKDGQVYTRQAPLGERIARGNAATAEFSSGVQQPVQYAVMEAADLQPSHLGGSQNLHHFLPEAQPKNRSAAFDPASQKAIADIAASPDLGRLGEAPNAYSGAPIVNQRGEALQGNGRAAGVREHYRTGGESYKRDVTAAAEKVGIPAEQTAKFKEPVLVRVADVSDQRARELGNYTAADTESGGKRRLDARQASGRLSDEGRTNLNRLATPTGDATLTETIRSNTPELLRLLRKEGVVNDTQVQTMVKPDGTLTPQGVEDIAALYRHQLFRDGDPNLPELFAELPGPAQGGLDRAVGALLSVPESASLLPQVQDAIGGVREYLASGVDFKTWANQADMFRGGRAPSEQYEPVTLKLIELLATEKRPTYIARRFSEYAAAVKGEDASLFGETPPKPRAEAVKDIFGVTDESRRDTRAEESAPRPVAADQRPEPPALSGEPSPAEAGRPAEPDAENSGASPAAGESIAAPLTERRLQQLDAEKEDLLRQLAEARKNNPMRGQALATLVPLPTITSAEASIYAKLAVNYLQRGVLKVQEVVARLRADLGASLGGASDEDLQKVVQYAIDDRAEQAQAARATERQELSQRQIELEQRLLGSATATEQDFKGTATGKITGAASRLQERFLSSPARRVGQSLNELAGRAAVSKNAFARELAYAINSVTKGFVQTREQQLRSEQFIGQARERPAKEAQVLYEGITQKLRDPQLAGEAQGQALRDSLRRLDRVLDPDFYEARTRPGFEELLRERLGADDFAALNAADIDDLFAEHTKLLSTEQLAAAGKLEDSDLTDRERDALQDLRQLYTFVHNTNFAIGKLSYDTWQAGRDEATGEATYAARLYQPYELPDELQQKWNGAMGEGKRMQSGMYQQRQETDAWKIANKIEDPAFAAVKRLRQTMANRAIHEYGQWLAETQPQLVVQPLGKGVAAQEAARQEGESRGFVQLGEGYGALSNAWVAPHVAEDFRGAFFTNKFMQRIYELTKAYGSGDASQHLLLGTAGKVRNLLKKTVTVYNPGTHVGNILNNVTLSWFAGVDPVTLAAEQAGAVKELREYSPTVRYLLDKGLLGGSLASKDFKENLAEFTSAFAPAPPEGVVKRGLSAMQQFYEGADTVAKVALFRSLVKQGMTAEAAADRVASALQNNKRIGKMYEVGSNLPVVGNPFGRWSADLARILGQGLVNRPLSVAAFALGLRVLGNQLSQGSGETEAERKLREKTASRIPMPEWLGGNISTSLKVTPSTSVDLARWFVPFYLYGGYDDDEVGGETLSKFSPVWLKNGSDFLDNEFDYTSNPAGPRSVALAKMAQDPLIAPALQLALDADFMGKSISDRNAGLTHQSTATPEEKHLNQAHFAFRAAFPGTGPLLDDLYHAAQDRENYFGKKRSVGQTVARFLGFKAEQFGTEQYQMALLRTVRQSQLQVAGEMKLMRQIPGDVVRGVQNGSISLDQALPRMQYRSRKVMDAYAKYKVAAQLSADYFKQRQQKPVAKGH